MNTIEINLNELEVKDLEGQIISVKGTEIHKLIGNSFYRTSPTIDVHKIAIKIHGGEPVEVTAEDLNIMLRLMDDHPVLMPLFNEAVKAYFTNKLNTLNK